jgi:hypothetical protein
MTAAEWGVQLTFFAVFILPRGNRQVILAVRREGEKARQIWPSMCQRHGSRSLHYAR